MSIAGLFAGIGGLELGFQQKGLHAAVLSEIDTAAAAVLKVRFPDSQVVVGDVTNLLALPTDTSIVTAGFPCQNLSMAGNKEGIGGAKSGVVSELFRLVEQCQVPTILIENVYFMLQLDRGRGMDWLVGQLERLKYRWAYRVLDTMGFGLPQRRRRIYLVASKTLDPRDVLFADESPTPADLKPTLDSPLGFYWTEGRSGVGLTVDGIPPLKGGSGLGIPSAPAVLFPDGAVLMPSITACERLQGFAPGWSSAADSLAKRARWRLLGNSVSVPVAEWVASRMALPGTALPLPTKLIENGARWPNAAFNVGAGRFAVEATDRPVDRPRPSIQAFRDSEWTPLSERALNGFITRAKEGGLRFPRGFLSALQAAHRRSRIAA